MRSVAARAAGSPAASIAAASSTPAAEVLDQLGTSERGLTSGEAAARLSRYGLNAVRSHGARPWLVLLHQLKSPLLGLLAAAAVASAFVGERGGAVIIGVILALSVGL